MVNVTPARVPAPARAVAGRSAFARPVPVGRLVGLDLARGVAMLGMFAVHVGPEPTVGGPLGAVLELARGRSAALFALLAGFTLVILTGRPEPRTGRAGRQAIGRVLVRAVVLVAMGYVLTALDTSVDVILSFYGLMFVLALPLCRLRAGALAFTAAAAAVVMPVVLYVLRASAEDGSWADAVITRDPLARLTGTDGVVELLVTGEYPVLTWLPFIIAGMAVARLDLSRPGVRPRLALTGGSLAVAGYGGSWLALHLVPRALSMVGAAADGGSSASAWWSDSVGEPETRTGYWLLVAAPHSQTTFSILGNTGVALLIVAACLAATERSRRLRWMATPLIALGSISLTAYVGHILAIKTLSLDELPDSAALPALLGLAAAAMLLAWAWTWTFRRGPLEYVLHTVTTSARWIK
jgi:uncharacterized membrane protein